MDSWLHIPPGYRPSRNTRLCVIMAMAALALILSLGAVRPPVVPMPVTATPVN